MNHLFHLFAGEQYYPGVGVSDYRGSYTNIDLAVDRGRHLVSEGSCEWWVILGHRPDGSLKEVDRGYEGE